MSGLSLRQQIEFIVFRHLIESLGETSYRGGGTDEFLVGGCDSVNYFHYQPMVEEILKAIREHAK